MNKGQILSGKKKDKGDIWNTTQNSHIQLT